MEWEDMVLSTLNFAAWEAKHEHSLETTLPVSPPAAVAPNTNALFERPGVSRSVDHRQETLLESKTMSKPGKWHQTAFETLALLMTHIVSRLAREPHLTAVPMRIDIGQVTSKSIQGQVRPSLGRPFREATA